jgi:hypothetical protein
VAFGRVSRRVSNTGFAALQIPAEDGGDVCLSKNCGPGLNE